MTVYFVIKISASKRLKIWFMPQWKLFVDNQYTFLECAFERQLVVMSFCELAIHKGGCIVIMY